MSQSFGTVGVTQVRIIGLAYGLLILAAVIASALAYYRARQPTAIKWPAEFPHGLSKPMLALEFAEAVDDIRQVVGDRADPRRAEMLASLKIDTFGFIPTYWLFFLSLSWLLAHRSISNAFWPAVVVAVCATVAALFDFSENHYIRVALETPLSQTATETVAGIYRSALIKWSLIFVAIGLLSPLFLGRHDLLAWIGIFFLLTSVLGFVGLFYHPAIEWSYRPLLISMIALAITFGLFPARFIQNL
jgi:hypothetical protein